MPTLKDTNPSTLELLQEEAHQSATALATSVARFLALPTVGGVDGIHRLAYHHWQNQRAVWDEIELRALTLRQERQEQAVQRPTGEASAPNPVPDPSPGEIVAPGGAQEAERRGVKG